MQKYSLNIFMVKLFTSYGGLSSISNAVVFLPIGIQRTFKSIQPEFITCLFVPSIKKTIKNYWTLKGG